MKTLLKTWSNVDEIIQKIERGILVLGMMTILVTGVIDIGLRLALGWGLGFADTLSRQITVWLGLFGAALATSHSEHINIDAFSRILRRRGLQINRIAIGVACIFMSGALTYYAIELVKFYMSNSTSYVVLGETKLKTWWLLMAFPVSFGVMTSRYLLHTFEYLYAFRGDPLPWSLVTQQMEEELVRRETPEGSEEAASSSTDGGAA
ncbi:MAG: TRAP transporter small permease subunit [Myxococcales bacterium]|nr:TRAP transporter small permease subunit [Myxococcales bacterium]MCB9642503.1 TRAP transporter small permease subunit [Myxococcales bacterium]